MLKIKNLKISYGDLEIINNADFQAGTGITCITGKSGSGKSSILNAITHQIEFKASQFAYKDVNLLEENQNFIRQKIAYLTQSNNFINDLTCFENIRLFAAFNKDVSNDTIIDSLNIVGLNQITSNTYPDNLSGGEKQRLSIAQAIAKGAEIILCDEITASLDQKSKNEVMTLLKKLVDDYGKTIIMTSHDENIYDVADKIYHIDNGKLNLIRDCKSDTKQKEIILKKQTLQLNLLNKYILSKLDRQKGFSLLYSIIIGFVVSICAFLTFFTITSLSEQKAILNRLCQNQIYIINQTEAPIGNNSYSYYTTNLVFDDEIVNQIKNVNGISKVYPYYWMSLVDPQELSQESTISLIYENKEPKIVNVTASPFDYAISPYYDEQGFDKKMEIINPENLEYGAYVNHIFLAMTGLTKDDLIGATIKVSVYVPVHYEEASYNTLIHDTGESFEQIVHEQIGCIKEIEIPIIGFVDFWYNEDWAQSFIYCPIDYIESLRLNVIDSLINENNINLWNPNAYIAFVDDLRQMEEVNIALRSIDDNIATGNKYTDNKAMYEQKRYVEITATVSVILVLGSGVLLSYVYGVYYYQKNKPDIDYFKRNKLKNSEYRTIVAFDCIYQIIINSFFSLPITIIITYFGQIYLNMYRFGLWSKESLVILMLLLIYNLIQSIISRSYYYFKSI